MSAFGTFGVRIGRHLGVYGIGSGGLVALGLVNLAVLTRFLPPAEFGRYAIFLVFSGLLTMLYNLGSLRGGLRAVFGGDDEDDDDDDEDEVREGLTRRALGTALILTALVGAAGTLAILMIAPTLAELLLDDRSATSVVMLAAAAGALGAVWRLASTVTRRERRSTAYVLLQNARPLLVLCVTVPLVAVDGDVQSAVLGLAIGSALAAGVSLIVTRRSFEAAFSFEDLGTIGRRGTPYVPYVLSYWTIQNAGIFFLAAYAPASDIGFYRLAAGVAAVASYAVAAFLKASGPMTREPIHDAVKDERGGQAAGGLLATYFFYATIGLMLVLVTGADLLVRIAPPAYADAAPLIPLLGLAYVLHGWFKIIKRTAKFPNRRATYISLVVIAGFVFIGAAFALVPPLGTYGAALAMVVAFLVAGTAMLVKSQRGPKPVEYAHRRIAAAIVIATACYFAGKGLGELAGSLAPLVEAAAVLAYPVLLVATGIVPQSHLRPLREVARATVPRRARNRNGGVELAALEESERDVLEVLVRERRPVGDLARERGASTEEVTVSFVAALRRAGGVGTPSEDDARIGEFLLSPAPVAERDQMWKRISSEGVSPLDTDALSLVLERLRRAPPEAWKRG